MTGRVLVYGLGVSGKAVTRALRDEGTDVVGVDDGPPAFAEAAAAELGVPLVHAPDHTRLQELAASVDEVVVSPGIPAHHPVFALVGVPLVGEVELAYRRARVPIVAVTGTNGKTTVVTLVTEMLRSSGLQAVPGGNIGTPLIEVVAGDAEVVVAEVSSFQLALTRSFRPAVGAWLNFSADHLDWHPDLGHYRAAKARLWANTGPGDVAVVNADDAVVDDEAATPAARGATVVRFGSAAAAYRLDGDALVGPQGRIVGLDELPRAFPHDVSDALCALATALHAGASVEGCRSALRAFRGLPHRVELVGEASGVRFYDDSKATTPGAVLAALEGFDSAVLVVGGRNKGLDLSVLRTAAPRLRAVVAIGEAADDVVATFEGSTMVRRATTMAEAVGTAAMLARPGDSVLLSPACASFDWYSSYAERGDDFARCVRALPGMAVAGGGER